jgi:hypothetical protein
MDRWAALLACLITAVSQTQMYFAQEVRSYQMLIAIATLTIWIMTRIECLGPTRRRAIALAAITFPLLLTHYFAAGAAIAVGLYGLLRLRGHRLAFLITCAAAGLMYVITWVPFALQQVNDLYTGDAFLYEQRFSMATELARLACAPWRILNDIDYQLDRMTLLAGILFLLPWFLLKRQPALLPWVLWLCFTLGAIVVLDAVRSTKHLIFPRYFAAISPAVVLLIVGLAWTIERKVAYVVGIGFTLLVAFGTRAEHRISVDSPTYAKAVDYVRQRIEPGEALLVFNGLADKVYNDMVALTFSHEPAFHSRPTVLMTQPLTSELLEALPPRAWMVMGGLDVDRKEAFVRFRILHDTFIKDEGYILYVQLREEGPPRPATAPAAEAVP